ncbi:MAG: hypothetical protein MJ211_00900 [Bacteroidales bacterium]|nr:hypothetical protein [Bacteroidales bacterium]
MAKRLKKYINKKVKSLKKVKNSLSRDYKKSKMNTKKGKRKMNFFCVLIMIVLGIFLFSLCVKTTEPVSPKAKGVDIAMYNYGSEIKRLSKQFNLSPSYLMALIMLESSGMKEVPPRFEKHVYKKLKSVQEKKISDLENISYKEISQASDAALKNLASSWGPFQLMGYKCIHLGIEIKDLRGENSLYYGVLWIDQTYGDYIRKKKYKDAFHIHNTGRPVPANGKYKTYNPDYVPNGIEYMKIFEEKFKE